MAWNPNPLQTTSPIFGRTKYMWWNRNQKRFYHEAINENINWLIRQTVIYNTFIKFLDTSSVADSHTQLTAPILQLSSDALGGTGK